MIHSTINKSGFIWSEWREKIYMSSLFFMGSFTIISLIFPLIYYGIVFFICYKIVVSTGLSKWMAFLGLFGVIGIFILLAIANGGTWKNNKTLNNTNLYDAPEQNYQKNYENNPLYSNNSYSNWNGFDRSKEQEDVYYHNGKRVERRYKKCRSCGASVDEKMSFCTFCGREF